MARLKKEHVTDSMGQLLCPECNSPMKPMSTGNGWRCSKAGKYIAHARAWTGCNGVIWDNQPKFKPIEIPRLTDFRKLDRPTEEQIAITRHHETNPKVRGSRLTIHNSGPGSGKTTTATACILPALFRRLKFLNNWYLGAFNKNAANELTARTPAFINVGTINGTFAKLQGLRHVNFKERKIVDIFFDSIRGLPKEETPSLGNIPSWCARMMDLLLFTDSDEKGFWSEAIGAAGVRFPGLMQRIGAKQLEDIFQYVPYCLTRTMMDFRHDFTDQYARPALEAIKRTGWKIPTRCVESRDRWNDEDISHLAKLIREIQIPQVNLVLDEAQDLSLSQIVVAIAATFRGCELVLIGDDYSEKPYKAGQAIFGWRGAFPGSLEFITRIWKELTGENAIELSLNLSQRCPDNVVKFVQPSNTVLKSAKPKGSGTVFKATSDAQAFTYWINADDNLKGLWITRKNAPLAPIFMATLRARKRCQLRGNDGFTSKIGSVLYDCAGWCNQKIGEFKVSLKAAMDKLAANMAEKAAEDGKEDTESMEAFILEVGLEIIADPSILTQAELPPVASVGNLKRFLLYFIDHSANRVLSTVYRSKGDEADYVVVSDVESLNASWNDDNHEAAAVRHVAATRSKDVLIVVGSLQGMDYSVCQVFEMPETTIVKATTNKPVVSVVVSSARPKKELGRPAIPYLPPAPVPDDGDLPTPGEDCDYLDDEKPAYRR